MWWCVWNVRALWYVVSVTRPRSRVAARAAVLLTYYMLHVRTLLSRVPLQRPAAGLCARVRACAGAGESAFTYIRPSVRGVTRPGPRPSMYTYRPRSRPAGGACMYVCKDSAAPAHAHIRAHRQARSSATPELWRVADATSHGLSAGRHSPACDCAVAQDPLRKGGAPALRLRGIGDPAQAQASASAGSFPFV